MRNRVVTSPLPIAHDCGKSSRRLPTLCSLSSNILKIWFTNEGHPHFQEAKRCGIRSGMPLFGLFGWRVTAILSKISPIRSLFELSRFNDVFANQQKEYRVITFHVS